MGQIKTKKKSNEITAIPELLSMLSLKGSLVTIDAMGCQKDIATKIVDKKADYLLCVKKNQKTLYEDIETIFTAANSATIPIEMPEQQTMDKGYVRLETRIYSIITDSTYLSHMEGWKNLSCIGKVIRICEVGAKKTEETRYFISSRELDIKDFSESVRGHCGIENTLHWVMDIVFRDDNCRVREKNASANFVTLKHITLNMLQSLPGKKSMRVRRKLAGWDDDFYIKPFQPPPGHEIHAIALLSQRKV